jgi:hypothetical protein
MKKILIRIFAWAHDIPFEAKNYWPYFDKRQAEWKEKGFKVGKVSTDKPFVFLQDDSYEFVYKVVKTIRLQGSDFLYGTEHEYNLEFVKAVKLK